MPIRLRCNHEMTYTHPMWQYTTMHALGRHHTASANGRNCFQSWCSWRAWMDKGKLHQCITPQVVCNWTLVSRFCNSSGLQKSPASTVLHWAISYLWMNSTGRVDYGHVVSLGQCEGTFLSLADSWEVLWCTIFLEEFWKVEVKETCPLI